jgi:hypothetical protein
MYRILEILRLVIKAPDPERRNDDNSSTCNCQTGTLGYCHIHKTDWFYMKIQYGITGNYYITSYKYSDVAEVCEKKLNQFLLFVRKKIFM